MCNSFKLATMWLFEIILAFCMTLRYNWELLVSSWWCYPWFRCTNTMKFPCSSCLSYANKSSKNINSIRHLRGWLVSNRFTWIFSINHKKHLTNFDGDKLLTFRLFCRGSHLSNNSIQAYIENEHTRPKELPEENMWTSDEFELYLRYVLSYHFWKIFSWETFLLLPNGLFDMTLKLAQTFLENTPFFMSIFVDNIRKFNNDMFSGN